MFKPVQFCFLHGFKHEISFIKMSEPKIRRYNTRSKAMEDILSSSEDEVEMTNCYCGYEEEFPFGSACPRCGAHDSPYDSVDSEDESNEQDSESALEFFDSDNTINSALLTRLKHEHPELYQPLVEAMDVLEKEMVSIRTILTSPVSIEDRAHLVEMYEIFMLMPPLTPEWVEMKHRLGQKLKDAIRIEEFRNKLDDLGREQMQGDLAYLENHSAIDDFEYRISALNLPVEEKVKIYNRYKLWKTMDPSNEEYGKAHTWLMTILKVPWRIYSNISTTDVDTIVLRIHKNFERYFYGLQNVKEQLILYIHHRLMYPESKDYMLGLLGPPGTGKTSIVQVLSKSMDTPIHVMSGGSFSGVDNIYGHSYTYIGSEPGEFVKACLHLQNLSGIIFIDEFEKIPMDKCLSALLHVLDPVQNHQFRDRYLDIPLDLSKMFFICSMNELPTDRALRDRIFPIRLQGYTYHEKFNILKRIALPKILGEINVSLQFTDEALRVIMSYANSEEGMRHIIQITQDVVRKLCFLETSTCVLSFSKDMKGWNSSVPITGKHIHSIINRDEIFIDNEKRGMYA